MRLSVTDPETVEIEGVADEVRVSFEGDTATGAALTSALLTRRRLPGLHFRMKDRLWRIDSADQAGPVTQFVFRRLADG